MIGKRIRQAREAAGLTQRDVAVRADITINTVSEIERGVNDNPGLQTLQSLAEALDVPLSTLLGEEAKSA